MLVLDDIVLSYGPIDAVRGVALEVSPGQIVALLGRNGAGKTTTLSGASGLIRPTRGRVLLDGKNLIKSSVATIARQGVAFVPEGRGVFAGMSVWENIATAAHAQGRDRRW